MNSPKMLFWFGIYSIIFSAFLIIILFINRLLNFHQYFLS
jgi:hypothetical protein